MHSQLLSSNTIEGWEIQIDRGAGACLILKVATAASSPSTAVRQSLADVLWGIADKHLNYRLVVELDSKVNLSPIENADLLLLEERIRSRGGLMRLVRQKSYRIDDSHLPTYDDCNSAIMTGSRSKGVMGAVIETATSDWN